MVSLSEKGSRVAYVHNAYLMQFIHNALLHHVERYPFNCYSQRQPVGGQSDLGMTECVSI